MAMIRAATGNHVEVRGPCSYRKPYGSPRSALLLDFMGKESFFCGGVNDGRFITENERHEGFCDNCHHTPQKRRNSPYRKPLKRVLINCDKDAEV